MIKQIEKNDCGQTTVRYILSKFSKCNYYASYPLKRKCDNVFQIKEELSDNGLLYDCYELNNDKLSTAQILKACNVPNWEKYQVINVKVTSKTFDDNFNRNNFSLKILQVNTNDNQHPKEGFKVDLQQDYERD